MAQSKNVFDYNHILANRNRRTGQMEYTLILRKGDLVTSISLTEDQFNETVAHLGLKEEQSLTHEENKVYIIL